MKAVCAVGDIRKITKTVTEADLATFETGNVHPFYATFRWEGMWNGLVGSLCST